jgi:ADP-heptose:LPS heptosyltransferase
MSFKAGINKIRKSLLILLTSKIGGVNNSINVSDIKINRILIIRPNNRLGNQLLISPLIQEIIDAFPDCKIDLFTRGGLANTLFEKYHNIDKVICLPKKPFKQLYTYINVWFKIRSHSYDLVINAERSSSSGRLATKISRARLKFYNDFDEELKERFHDYIHNAKYPVYNFRKYISHKQIDVPIPLLDLKISDEEIKKGKEILGSLVDNSKKTICLYTFATGDKCFDKPWWSDMYDKLKKEFEHKYNILEVLPIENLSQIDFKATSYYSRDIREMGSVFANSEIYFGADCGIMHLASSSLISALGLFSVTSIELYGPYGNNSQGLDVTKHSTEDILNVTREMLLTAERR